MSSGGADAGDFNTFLRRRGFDPDHALPLLKRMFVECWREPDFRGFWRLWNPVYGYGLYRLYVLLGGNRHPRAASLVVFLFCGAALHDVPVGLLTGRFTVATTVAFFVYWLWLAAGRGKTPAVTVSFPVLRNVGRIGSGLAAGVLVHAVLLG